MRIPFLSRKQPRRVLVLGLDGVPYPFLQQRLEDGSMPSFAALVKEGSFLRAESVQPTVSCVAWTCYMTGQNPGKHSIFGFQDLRPGSYQSYIPNAAAMKSQALWEILSKRGKRVIVMNVPVTYPPRQVSGLLVGGFLSPKLEGATWPAQLAERLARHNYKIDVDPWLARESLDKFYDDLMHTFQARRESFLSLLREEKWDFAQCHIMGTDRINHFMWELYETGDKKWASRFVDYYRAIDGMIGEIVALLKEKDRLLVLSDHGFCTLKKEVHLNVWLREEGLLVEPEGERPRFDDLDGQTRVFSMTPGRFYVNLKGTFPHGCVDEDEAEVLLQQLQAGLAELHDREDGSPTIAETLRREQLYHGPQARNAPDLVAVPHDGYDLKGTLGQQQLFSRGAITGMHTYGDAFWLTYGVELSGDTPNIMDGAPTVLAMLGEEPEADMDGISRLA